MPYIPPPRTLDPDLEAIAALPTQPWGRNLLTLPGQEEGLATLGAAPAWQGALAATATQPGDLIWTKVMDLVSINGFAPIGAPWPNELWINSEGLKLVRFGLGRATNPGLNVATIALSWSGYPSNGGWDKLVLDNNDISRMFINTNGGVTSLNYISFLNNGTVGTVGYLIYL